jgi:hypothetical protein
MSEARLVSARCEAMPLGLECPIVLEIGAGWARTCASLTEDEARDLFADLAACLDRLDRDREQAARRDAKARERAAEYAKDQAKKAKARAGSKARTRATPAALPQEVEQSPAQEAAEGGAT